MTNQCFDGWHLRLTGGLALPGLLFLGVGIPLAFARMLHKRRHELGTDVCKKKLGYAYKSFRQAVVPCNNIAANMNMPCRLSICTLLGS